MKYVIYSEFNLSKYKALIEYLRDPDNTLLLDVTTIPSNKHFSNMEVLVLTVLPEALYSRATETGQVMVDINSCTDARKLHEELVLIHPCFSSPTVISYDALLVTMVRNSLPAIKSVVGFEHSDALITLDQMRDYAVPNYENLIMYKDYFNTGLVPVIETVIPPDVQYVLSQVIGNYTVAIMREWKSDIQCYLWVAASTDLGEDLTQLFKDHNFIGSSNFGWFTSPDLEEKPMDELHSAVISTVDDLSKA
mgnify:CR=1 FL=1